MDLTEFDKAIWQSYYEKKSSSPRHYIGASSIGHLCDRKVWLDWKGIVNPKDYMTSEQFGKKQEIYQRGHEEEERFIEKLIQAGFEITDRQLSFDNPEHQMRGHCDGVLTYEGTRYLLEIKTMKSNSWRATKKWGIKKQYPQYITQIQMYMHYFNLNQTIVFCLNKDVDFERYIEIVEYDSIEVYGAYARAKRIISYKDQMPSLLGLPQQPSYICHMCDYFNFCYKEDECL